MDQATLGRQAEIALHDPVLNEAFEAVRKSYIDQMVNSASDAHEKREHWHKCLHALADVKTALTLMKNVSTIQKVTAAKKEKLKHERGDKRKRTSKPQ